MATELLNVPADWSRWLLPSQRSDIEKMWDHLVSLKLTGRKLAVFQNREDQEVFLHQLLAECNIVEEWYHLSLLQNWIDHAIEQEPLAKRLQGDHWPVLRQQLHDVLLTAVKSTMASIQPHAENPEVPIIPAARTRRNRCVEEMPEEVDRNQVEQLELQRWSREFHNLLKVMEAPVLEELQMSLDPDRAIECLTGSFRASTVRGYVRPWKCFVKWLSMVKGKANRTSAADYIDYIFFRRDEPCGKTVPLRFLQAAKWIEAKAGLVEGTRFAESMAFKSVVERVTGELQSVAAPVKRAPRLPARIIEEMESYVLDQDRPVYLRCVAWVRLVKTWATLRYDCHTHISPADIRFYEGRLTVTLRHSKTTGANKRVSELPVIVSEYAFIRDPTWLERGFELLRSVAPFRRDYLLPAPTSNWSGMIKKMASYEVAASAGQALLADLRRTNDGSPLLPSETVPFFTEHSERATAPSILATLNVQKSDRDLLGRWCPEGSDTYMRTYKTVVAKLQAKMAEALRSPTRYKDLEEHELIPDLVCWLRERAFLDQMNAEDTAETFAAVMRVSSFSADWVHETPTQQPLQQVQGPITLGVEGEASDEEVPIEPRDRDEEQFLLVFAAGKKGATLHNTGKCWMARSRSFTSLEIRPTKPSPNEYARVCKLCWPNAQQVQEQESSSSESDRSAGDPDDDWEANSVGNMDLQMSGGHQTAGELVTQLDSEQEENDDANTWNAVEPPSVITVAEVIDE